ncbi:MAG: DNA polymerase III subunit delta' [Deltaproteobacteria bacterium]|nr:DNA polymerase III subunit delta' [Deltaproteobacteria bacterium]
MTEPLLQGFRSVRGHEAAIGLLRRAIVQRRTASAYLFSGPLGVGKDRVAHALAQTMNCTARETPADDACGECTNCRRIANGQFADLLVVKREFRDSASARDRESDEPDDKKLRQEIVVEQMKPIMASVAFRPHEGGTRWIIIREADRLHPNAANKLLKTLEEPPAETHFVLLSHRPSALLPTIRSRCQTVNFGLLDEPDVRAVLEGLELTPEHITELLPLAEGSVGRALIYKDPKHLAARKKLLEEILSALRVTGVAVGGFVELATRYKEPPEKPDQFGRAALDETLALLYRHLRNEALTSSGKAPRQSLVNAHRAEIVRETMDLLDGATSFNVGMQLQNMLVRLREVRP